MKIPLPIAGAQAHREPRVVGIDLGTTNSLVAVMERGVAHVIPDEAGERLLPSVVYYPAEGPPVVGAAARPGLVAHPERTVYSVKRLMGRALADLTEERERLPYPLTERQAGILRIAVGERQFTAPEVSAHILRALKSRAEAHLGEPVEQAVITAPAYFNDSQRQATRDAGRIAGLDVLRIVNEPTAACLAYGLDRRREGIVAVYDLGGGTFDISILKLKDGIFEVQATNGDTHLGGDDFDGAIAERLREEVTAAHAQPGLSDAGFLQQLRLAAEAAKRSLTDVEATRVELTLPNGSVFVRELTRRELEELIEPWVARTLGPCRQALADAGISAAQVDEVVLVGGSTRTPLVRRRVQALFGRAPHTSLNPDEVVALGAAVQAGILSGQVEGLLLLDVNPLSLGLETYGGAVEKLVPRNSTIPCTAQQTFTTAVDGQTAFDLHVVQGEREMARDCRSLARFQIHIPPAPAGWPKLEVTFLVDENGILSVSGYEHRSQSEARIEVRPSYGLTDEEVEGMVFASFEHAEQDLQLRVLVEARVEGEQVLLHARKQLPRAAEFVTAGTLTAAQTEGMRQRAAALQDALAGTDVALLRRRIEELDSATRPLAEQIMNQAVQEALAGRSLGTAAALVGATEGGE